MFELENKLFELSVACQQNGNEFAEWVMYTVERYVTTGRSSREFEKKFLATEFEDFQNLINYCLKGKDYSDMGMLKRVLQFYKCKKPNAFG